MVVGPSQHIDMQSYVRRLGPTGQTVMYHLRVESANHGAGEAKLPNEKRARGNVQDRAGEGFVQRCIRVPEARNASARAEGFREGAT